MGIGKRGVCFDVCVCNGRGGGYRGPKGGREKDLLCRWGEDLGRVKDGGQEVRGVHGFTIRV